MTGNGYRPKIAAVLMAGLLVVAAAACGGGSSSSAPSVESNESTTTTTTRAGSDATTGGSSTGSNLDDALAAVGGSAGSCLKISLAYASVSAGLLGGLGAALGGGQNDLTDAESQLQSIQADIPPELKDAFATVSKTISSYADTLKGLTGNILDPAYQQRLEEASKKLDTPEFTDAQKKIENYLDANCPN